MRVILGLILVLCLGCNVDIKVESFNLVEVLTELQPALKNNPERAKRLADAILKHSAVKGLDWKIVLSILVQESSLRMDPNNCAKRVKPCNDMGIGQVRFSIWGKKLNIDKKRLLTDEDYAIDISTEVLKYSKLEYGIKELNWFTRYHSGTPAFRDTYMRNLNRAYKRINEIIAK